MEKQVVLFNPKTGTEVRALISEVKESDLPEEVQNPKLEKDWYFSWKEIFKGYKEHEFYKICVDDELQGLIRISFEDSVYLILQNIELAPFNVGRNGKYQKVAESLFAYALDRSFDIKLGLKPGYLVLQPIDSKVAKVYQEKYDAKYIDPPLMIIGPRTGRKLIDQFFNK